MIFLHGWPSLGLMWRAQMEAFAKEGWHCVAPDLRGYGRSSIPLGNDAYTLKEVMCDMTQLHDHLGGQAAVWVGHDWGSCIASTVAAHEPARACALILTSQAYQPEGYSLNALISVVDRERYPTERYPYGQWEGYRRYYTHFKSRVATLDRDPAATLKTIFTKRRSPDLRMAFGDALRAELNWGMDRRLGEVSAHQQSLWSIDDFAVLLHAFQANGFRAPCAWYLNDDANVALARLAPAGGRLAQPVMFINGDFDDAYNIVGNRQGDPMRRSCSNLTIVSLPGGRWLPLELASDYTDAIRTWLHHKGIG
jgi:pimeloyl-ACP methyl ester carboxylesterase